MHLLKKNMNVEYISYAVTIAPVPLARSLHEKDSQQLLAVGLSSVETGSPASMHCDNEGV